MVSRLDLDGTYSPFGLVSKILDAEPNLKIPVPIEDLAYELDISEIQTLKTEGFEGGLLTDEIRSFGAILVKGGVIEQRRRFTIGHELGHFLIVHHRAPDDANKFLCDRKAFRQWDMKTQNKYNKIEAEANQFASLLLMPPPHLRKIINNKKYNTLSTVLEIHEKFFVSKEAAARAYAEYNENVAVVICKDNKFVRSYRNRNFPWINLRPGDAIPEVSDLYKISKIGEKSFMDETPAEYWIDTEAGKRIPKMFEQVMLQSNRFAMILLSIVLTSEEDFDPLENMTAKERFRYQQDRWHN